MATSCRGTEQRHRKCRTIPVRPAGPAKAWRSDLGTLLILGMVVACGTALSRSPADVRVLSRVDPLSATVGDPLRLELEVTCPRDAQVLPPVLAGKTGELVVLETLPAAELPAPDPAHARRVYRYSVASYRPGDVELPGIEVVVKRQPGQETRASSSPVKINIRSILKDNDTQLRDLKKQAELPGARNWLPWILAAAAFVLAAAAWWWRSRRRPRITEARMEPAPPEDPFLLAERQLNKLQSRDLPGQGRVKDHYVELSEIVRRILEAGCGVPTLERTTEEIIAELRAREVFPVDPAGVRRVQALLDLCDMVKFAKYVSTATENDSALQVARRLLEDCRQPGRAVPVSVSK